MKKLRLFSLIVAMSALYSCSDQKGLSHNDDDLSIAISAEVSSILSSKTVTDNGGHSSFIKNDKIGLFVPDNEQAMLWNYDGNIWTTNSVGKWKNRNDKFEFMAFYPCGKENISRDNIPMPDLSFQTGKLSDIGEKDFLVARCSVSYNDNNGVVSFTGENSFKHVYSLLHIIINSGDNKEEVSITGCKFNGEGIVTNHKYIFGSAVLDDGIVAIRESKKSILEINYNPVIPVTDNHEIVVLLNPVSLDVPLEFTLSYEKDGIKHSATADITKEFPKGSYRKVTLNWVKDGLKISDNTIVDWNILNMDDILLQGFES